MNRKQRIILRIVAILFIAMLLFPPFSKYLGGNKECFMGYIFILGYTPNGNAIDKEMLLIQFLVVAVVGGISFLLSRTDKELK